ncbi:hypothetical protein HF908_23080 (plasmid) [Ralstonia pseudosolanacearum]|uniref:Uncharacterized protein n=1 Tax=Ralstonia solanacearum TaxID=305 RepID=A0AA92K6A7_RALSL|nr:hypothetical protein [Ralstonia pseudosolanacearum]QOK94284.1 hypothetical protein HF908_23080 [Ralstonia pseudosolanacearum]QOK99159.1 hypothetical protein HF909_22660 [Ralstonia pseudosolanacearum]
MKRLQDVPNWAIFRCHATFRFLYYLQAMMDDIVGATKASQWEVAVHNLREAVLLAVSIQKMPESSNVVPDVNESFKWHLGSYNPCGDHKLEALSQAVNVAAKSPSQRTVDAAMSQLKNYVRETELLLGYNHEIPELRSAKGTSMLLRLLRETDQFSQSIGLPSAVPAEWLTKEKK